MPTAREILTSTLADRRIEAPEVAAIRDQLLQDGQLNLDDVKLLVELYCDARDYCPEFEDLFFDVLEKVILADGLIQPSEQFYLLKMLYSDREIRPRERQFLRDLKARATEISPEFEALCRQAFDAADTGWDVGGRA